jgi:release factor glutamine methyltransferase
VTTVAALLAEAAHADAALFLAHVLGRDRAWLVAHGEASVNDPQAKRFQELCARRLTGEPLAYIAGSAWFYSREFLVNESVLIPRPETEHLIDEALAYIGASSRGNRVLDVGTGSGAIACTIAAESGAIVDATDISAEALDVARSNTERLGVADRVQFLQGDLAAPVRNNRYDLIIANLPYVPTNDVPKPPDPVSFEPRIATDGGPDGLSLYRRLVPTLPDLINEDGMVLLECAPPTYAPLKALLQLSLPNFVIEGGKDYAGLDRYVKAVGKRGQ